MQRRWLRMLLWVVPLGVLSSLPAARATLLRILDLPELVAAADRIVVADVHRVRTAWNSAHSAIYTSIEVNVSESWKGPSAGTESITIRQLGGAVGEIEMTVHGMPTFSVGERALLFLRGTQVVGMSQGKRSLRWEPATRRWLVDPAARPAAVVLAPRNKRQGAEPYALEDLDSLRAKIRTLVGK